MQPPQKTTKTKKKQKKTKQKKTHFRDDED